MIVLILGSGPNVVTCRDWPRAPFDRIVAINNAWRVRPDWDDLVFPEDFPAEKRPVGKNGRENSQNSNVSKDQGKGRTGAKTG